MSEIDLSLLPAPDVVETIDFEALVAARVARVQTLATAAGVLASWDPSRESDPILIQLQEGAYREAILRARVNDAARAVLLAHATGGDLDAIAAGYGVARLAGEKDERLRVRTQLAMEGFSTAGPVGAYRFHALSADLRVKDVAISSPEPGDVLVTVLSTEGDGTASPALLAIVAAALNDQKVRPLNDTVLVQSATILPYSVEAVLDLFSGPDPATVLVAARKAVAAYTTACHALGALVARSGLDGALHATGVRQVHVLAPTGAAIDPGQTAAAYCTAITVTEGSGNG